MKASDLLVKCLENEGVGDAFLDASPMVAIMGDLQPMLRDALTRDAPVIIDVPIDYSDNDLIYRLL
jgi:thiamine pyrophosphate-dependent acetolactate synthase large subunit-like protein